jgi:hypothetical protein
VSDDGGSGRRRRRRGRGGPAKAAPPAKSTGAGKSSASKSSGASRSSGTAKGAGRGAAPRRRPGGADFWGRPSGEPSAKSIRPTPDPGAVPRSLGDPPIGPNPVTAAGSLAVIYEEAVRAATALAAANGLLADESED